MQLIYRAEAYGIARPCIEVNNALGNVIIESVVQEAYIAEMQTVEDLAAEHRPQLLASLNATNFQFGLLVNFDKPGKLEYERIARNHGFPKHSADLRLP